ncbi:hypothetical protein LPJ59_000327 [Coemansia sp. RSA 2399]|nr:hypothetical protein LPJ59_000327 [Coemansia sp. RSA 2399]KAJ1907849.1 hypothetical protein LPJ81_000498 [Coemansia sp. IMI 209127]
MSNSATNALVPALAASLSLLEAQQQQIIARLRVIYTQLSAGDKCGQDGEEELLTTLTYYINQANAIQRRMMLIHGRMGDLKRRSERLREHHSKQHREMTSWMEQEQSRQVPEAAVALAPKSKMMFSPSITAEQNKHGMQSSSLPVSPFLDRFKLAATTRSARSSPPPSQSAGLFDAALERTTSVEGRNRSNSNSSSTINPLRLVNVPATPPMLSQAQVRSSSPTPSIASTVDSAARPSDSVPIATVKRKGKRRVRVPTIE